MEYVKVLFAVALVLIMCSAFSLEKDHSKTTYVPGVTASSTDTVVYFADIQMLDNVKVSKEGFPTHRGLYSCQLKNCVEDNELQQSSICMICLSKNRRKLEKEATKTLSKYKRNKDTTITRVDTDKFHPIKPEE